MALLLMMGWGALLLGALWLKAGRPRPLGAPPAGQPQGDWPQLVTLGALSVVLWVSVLCLSGGGDAPAEG